MHSTKFFCTEYEKSKVVADKIALEAAKEGVPIVAVYPGLIYGPGKLTAGNIVAQMVTFQETCIQTSLFIYILSALIIARNLLQMLNYEFVEAS